MCTQAQPDPSATAVEGEINPDARGLRGTLSELVQPEVPVETLPISLPSVAIEVGDSTRLLLAIPQRQAN